MCTLSWIHDPSGCRIYFNRDEKRTRLPARLPAETSIDGVRVLTPADGNAGGSWLTVNEYGIAVAVLNFYEAEAKAAFDSIKFESRGHLVLGLSSARSLAEARHRLHEINPDLFKPFFIVLFDGDAQGRIIRWDGRRLQEQELPGQLSPVSTSSFNTAEVLARRQDKFNTLKSTMGGPSDAMLSAFHHSRDDMGGPYSVTMTRPDALTVSFSMVTIGMKQVSFYYQPRHPDGVDPGYLPGSEVTLART
jgi:Transport and Golgi organisation 2